jgi:hypothetical protein
MTDAAKTASQPRWHLAGRLPRRGPGYAWLHPTCMPEMNHARLALAGREVRRLLGFSEATQ